MEQKLKKGFASRARGWYAKLERPISSISLIGGFVFDALTLRRVDLFWDNVWVGGHLLIVTVCTIWINLLENEPILPGGIRHEENPQKIHFWLVNVMQFFYGGIFSTYLVFYFRSATLAATWPFLLILAIAFIANERLKRHYARVAFQITLLFLTFYAFAIYIMPIVLHEISTRIFVVSGIVSLAAIMLVIAILKKYSHERFRGWSRFFAALSIVVVLAGINVLYFYHLIPPLPLSLTDAQIYQTFTVNGPGNYTAQYEDQSGGGIIRTIENYFNWDQVVHITPGQPLFAYTAIFAPTALDTNVIHEWQSYDPTSGVWTTRARVTLPVSGGGDNGWRTFSEESGITAGSWRVNVLTPAGGIIGRLNFNVVIQNTGPALTTEEID
jgi:hypothetical protein